MRRTIAIILDRIRASVRVPIHGASAPTPPTARPLSTTHPDQFAAFAAIDKHSPGYGDLIILTLAPELSRPGTSVAEHERIIAGRNQAARMFGQFWENSRYKFEGATALILDHGTTLTTLTREQLAAVGLQRVPAPVVAPGIPSGVPGRVATPLANAPAVAIAVASADRGTNGAATP